MVCAAQRFSGGDGRDVDWWMANSRLRAVLRHPNAALTLAGLGGGTIVDAAPWGRPDSLLEAAPLVDGGWLSVDEAVVEDDRITWSGALRALPYRPIAAEGERRTVTVRVEADSPWLRFDGATGLWLHASDDLALLDGWLVGNQVVYGHDGVIAEDLGGAVVIEGMTGLLISDTTSAWAERGGPTRTLSGLAPGADAVRLYRAGTQVGVVTPDQDGAYDVEIPVDVTDVRAYAGGRAPSPLTPAADASSLDLGPRGQLRLRAGWPDGGARPIRVVWRTPDGRSGEGTASPEGALVDAGAGVFDVDLSAGPAFDDVHVRAEVAAGTTQVVDVVLPRWISTDTHVLADLAFDAASSRNVRQSMNDRSGEATGAGMSYVVAVAQDDVPEVTAWLNDQQWLQWDTGATLTSPDGWTVTAWPWADNPREAGRGAPRARDLSPVDALGIAWGGAATSRQLAVNLAWMEAVPDSPIAMDPRPTAVRLDPPGAAPFDRWKPWYRWLDAQRFVLPVGPLTWLDVRDNTRFGPVELRRAVHYGRYCTGTGALLQLTLDQAAPGEVIVPTEADTDGAAPPSGQLHLDLQRGPSDLDRLSVIIDGAEAITFPIDSAHSVFDTTVRPGVWTLAVAWSTRGADWVATSPVWRSAVDRPMEAIEHAP